MPFPTIGALATRLYDQISQAQASGDDEAAGWPLAVITGGLLDVLQWVSDACEPDDTYPAGGRLMDPDETPSVAIDWLAQFAGVRPTKGASEATRRDEAKTAAGRKRGRPTSMVADVVRTLTGTQAVTLTAFYGGNRWRLLLVTYDVETPDPAATERAAQGQKPYGIVGHGGTENLVRVDPGWSIGQMHEFHAGETGAEVAVQYADGTAFSSVIPEV